MTIRAVVREWHEDEGWGVLDAPEIPGGCWAHFSHVQADGYRSLAAGQEVALEWAEPGQDGYGYRAVRVWPWGTDPVAPTRQPPDGAYSSTLTVNFD